MTLLPILCDCGHGEKMAEYDIERRRLLIKRIRAGEVHVVTIEIDTLRHLVENKSETASHT